MPTAASRFVVFSNCVSPSYCAGALSSCLSKPTSATAQQARTKAGMHMYNGAHPHPRRWADPHCKAGHEEGALDADRMIHWRSVHGSGPTRTMKVAPGADRTISPISCIPLHSAARTASASKPFFADSLVVGIGGCRKALVAATSAQKVKA